MGAFIGLLFERPEVYVTAVATVIFSITLHEMAHGIVATKLGDPTPHYSGHMTWNPWVHMGPFSLLAAFLVGIAWGAMPVDPSRLRGKRAETLVAIAGPLTNLALAFLALTALGLWIRAGADPTSDPRVDNGMMVLKVFGTYNVLLFIFNMLPVPPLDGSRVVADFNRGYAAWMDDPANAGVRMFLFIGCFLAARVIFEPFVRLINAYLGFLGG
jgi:Zn-dependent protease